MQANFTDSIKPKLRSILTDFNENTQTKIREAESNLSASINHLIEDAQHEMFEATTSAQPILLHLHPNPYGLFKISAKGTPRQNPQRQLQNMLLNLPGCTQLYC